MFFYKKFLLIILFFLISFAGQAQKKDKKFQFFGGFGLSINTEFFSVSLQPGVLYNFSPKFKLGTALQYAYAKSNSNYYGVNYSRNMYGGNAMALFYPIDELEISGEYELLHINEIYNSVHSNYWSPALFGGVGYYAKHFVVGFKLNFLFSDKSIYKDPLIPFVRIYF